MVKEKVMQLRRRRGGGGGGGGMMYYLWNVMLRKSNEDGLFTETLEIYSSMVKSIGFGFGFGNNFTFPLVLKASAKLRSIRDGTKLHSLTFLMGGLHADLFVQTALIDFYSKCYDLPSSRRVFDEMPHTTRNLVSWNSIISAYCRHLRINDSFSLFKRMLFLALQPSSATFLSILSSSSLSSGQGLSLHCYIIKLGLLHSELPISNSVMSMYVHFGQVDDARCIFYSINENERSIVSWTTILRGYLSIGDIAQAFDLFNQMRRESANPDCIALVNLISGCAQAGNLLLASSVHSVVLKSGCGCDHVHDDHDHPIDNLLVSMYAKCGDLVSSRNVFDMVREKSVFLWTSMISGYTHFGDPEEAVNLFKKMLRTSTRPNEITIATILSACANLGSPSVGGEIEEYILQLQQQQHTSCLASNLHIQASLIHMHCKCGNVDKAKQVFEGVFEKDLAIWSSMINGYAIHGMGEEALSLFHKMQCQEGIKPDAVVYTSILMACSHSGLVEDGLMYFKSMQRNLKIEPRIEHYSCIVDLLGRAGYLDLALKSIQEMPAHVQAQVWAPLLSACRKHHNIELGEFAANKLLDLNPARGSGSASISNYVAIANFYTSAGKWKEAAIVRHLVNNNDQDQGGGGGGSVKEPGWSQIEINGSLHVFTAGDRSHHQSSDIDAKVEQLHAKLLILEEAGGWLYCRNRDGDFL